MKKITVMGAGFMGSGIAQVAAQAGYNVILNDVTQQNVENGMENISKNLERRVGKGKLSVDTKLSVMNLISKSANLEDAKDSDFIIEAIFEDFDTKKKVFQKLDRICRQDVIFASNTSSISITKLAATVNRPDRFIGMHFFAPVPAVKLVEIIRGIKTSVETVNMTEEIVSKIRKESVRVKDVPGFLVNRINHALRNEAYRCLAENVACIQDIDKAVKYGLGHPIGPFELADFLGLDVNLNVAKILYDGYKDVRWCPNILLEQLVVSGDLGRKTGKGWYDYTSGEMKPRTDIEI
ncbi:MAG: 3-hydroxyacyl-CoA dehydrogenase family protein [Deltaproteobacteria bacterium]|nr:3-hydroxyacyl-CoA dehydrogenase family protein [Deltaproteobacteria bacterium]